MSLDPSTFPETFEEKDLKAAQSITGELAWLAQRCRPDLAYTVSVMSSMMSKDPSRAVQIGMKTLAYLNLTKDWKLRYHAGRDPSLIVFTDSSYAPEVMVVPLCFGQEHLSLGGVRGRPLLRPPVLKRSYWQQVKGRHLWPR